MAFIPYIPDDDIPAEDRVPDTDHIIRVHGVHPRTMRHHYDLYVELMRGRGPLTRVEREMVAVVVSAANGCRY
jgi:alkylhydroperoxidase family enzyme